MSKIGSLEEMVILLAAALGEKAYAVSIAKEYIDRTGQEISIPAIHTVLKRLEDKSLLKSYDSAPTAERGGRKKRIYEVTILGMQIVEDLKNQRDELWSVIPRTAL